MPAIPNFEPDPQLPQYRYNEKAKRYIGNDGRFVGQATIRNELDKVLDNITADMIEVSKSFRTGQIDGATFQTKTMQLIKDAHLTGAAMERGGWANMTQSDFGRVGQIVRQEYAYHRRMIEQIASGEQRLDGTLDTRLRLYGQAARGTYHVLERETRAIQGYDQERSILHGRDSCTSSKRSGCIEQAAKGWQLIGKMVPIGSRTCLSNCRCSAGYRNSKTGEVLE